MHLMRVHLAAFAISNLGGVMPSTGSVAYC